MADADTVVTDPQRLSSGRPILARVPTLSPFVSLRRLSATILPLTAMPLTTPLTVSAASLSSSNSSHIGETPDSGPDSDEPQLRFDLEALSAVSEASATTTPTPSTASSAPAARSSTRRLTFTRFPLLRKGSRELTRATSAHFRGSSISAAAPPSRADSPFLSTGAPRASRTSFAQGRTEQPTVEPSSARDPSAHASLRSGSIGGEEPGNIHDTTSLQQAAYSGKMHQTSSRLLRMTDDERPYTRVSAFSVSYAFEHRQTDASGRPPTQACNVWRGTDTADETEDPTLLQLQPLHAVTPPKKLPVVIAGTKTCLLRNDQTFF